MQAPQRLRFLDNLRTFLIFLVVVHHAGLVYESGGIAASFWIVDDPATSDLPGLLNIVLDLFVMFTLFFVAGYFVPSSLDGKSPGAFLAGKARRLLIPWLLALFTLIPLYKVVFLASRGLPQEPWTTYFHFTNDNYGMNWLWFLPLLFLFDAAYVLLRKMRVREESLSPGAAVAVVGFASFAYTFACGAIGWLGWTHTLLVDFQKERLLPYFLFFLLGAVFGRRNALAPGRRRWKAFVAVGATAWLPIFAYTILLLNYIFHPGQPIVGEFVDGTLFWLSSILSTLALLYTTVTTFRFWIHRSNAFARALARCSYGTYVLHVVVLGAVAWLLLGVDLPGLVKYPILFAVGWTLTNLLVLAYAAVRDGYRRRREASTAVSGRRRREGKPDRPLRQGALH